MEKRKKFEREKIRTKEKKRKIRLLGLVSAGISLMVVLALLPEKEKDNTLKRIERKIEKAEKPEDIYKKWQESLSQLMKHSNVFLSDSLTPEQEEEQKIIESELSRMADSLRFRRFEVDLEMQDLYLWHFNRELEILIKETCPEYFNGAYSSEQILNLCNNSEIDELKEKIHQKEEKRKKLLEQVIVQIQTFLRNHGKKNEKGIVSIRDFTKGSTQNPGAQRFILEKDTIYEVD